MSQQETKATAIEPRHASSYRGARRMAARRTAKKLNETRDGAAKVRWPQVFRQYFKVEFKSARRS